MDTDGLHKIEILIFISFYSVSHNRTSTKYDILSFVLFRDSFSPLLAVTLVVT